MPRELWVQHFVSDDADIGIGTTKGKFLQAISKFAAQYYGHAAEFGANAAINDYLQNYNDLQNPGLGKNKERQIQHHIARVHDFLLTGCNSRIVPRRNRFHGNFFHSSRLPVPRGVENSFLPDAIFEEP